MKEKGTEDNFDRNPAVKKFNVWKEILSFIIEVVIVAVCIFGLITFVAQRTEVSGSSMESTLQDGDNLIIEKVSYRFSDPNRFDIIVFPFKNTGKYFIKRIIGLPNEKIQIDYDGNIYINDKILEETYGREVIIDPGIASEAIILGEDEYFVLGDNRNNSKDSRDQSVGVIKKDIIKGRAFIRIWPLNKFKLLK